MNQQIMFLSDGGDTVRDLQMYLSPESEHLLDWFHVTMRLTVMGQLVKGLAVGQKTRNESLTPGPSTLAIITDLEKHLDSLKWNL